MIFPEKINAVLMAGGTLKNLPANELCEQGKGHILIGGQPMAARTLEALNKSHTIGAISLVTPVSQADLGPEWQGIEHVCPAGNKLIESMMSGLKPFANSTDPVMLVAGDLPFLSAQAVDDFVERCRKMPDTSLWYGFVDKKASQAKYPDLEHTWVTMAEGTFCGAGIVLMRPQVAQNMQDAMAQITAGRKNPFKLAKILSWKALFYLLLRRLTVPMAEDCANRLLNCQCRGVISPYPETAYNVDDGESLIMARRDAELLSKAEP